MDSENQSRLLKWNYKITIDATARLNYICSELFAYKNSGMTKANNK